MQVVNDFNDTFLFMVKDIASVCPKSIIGTNVKEIERLVLNKENQTFLIDTFVSRVLKYKDEIRARDERFFVEKTYDNDVDSNAFLLNKVLEFKSIWSDLKPENKEIVLDYMNILCDLAEQYFLSIYKK